MDANYGSAARRHLADAQRLAQNSRWDNAGYLGGYVAECGAKAVIELATVRVRIHVDRLSPKILALAADVSLASRRYPLDLDGDLATIRDLWKPELRYAATESLPQSDAEALVDAAARVFERTVVRMVLDGLLERMPQ
jgi:HEPN domain-containing protein